jgi:hypothetical protein
MSFYAEVCPTTLQITKYYFSDFPKQKDHIPFPAGSDPCRMKAIRNDSGEIEIIEDSIMSAMFTQKIWNIVKNERNRLLSESDWTQFNDSPLTEDKKMEWREYRARLRDIPEMYTDPNEVEWPQMPQ